MIGVSTENVRNRELDHVAAGNSYLPVPKAVATKCTKIAERRKTVPASGLRRSRAAGSHGASSRVLQRQPIAPRLQGIVSEDADQEGRKAGSQETSFRRAASK
jgi:hypothetical protein